MPAPSSGIAIPIYVMEDSLRRLILSAEVFTALGYLLGNVNLIADSSLASIPAGGDLAGEMWPDDYRSGSIDPIDAAVTSRHDAIGCDRVYPRFDAGSPFSRRSET